MPSVFHFAVSLFLWLALLPRGVWAADDQTPLSNYVAVAAQWRAAVVPGAGGNTLELFVSNTSSASVVFGAIEAPASDLYWWQWYPSSNAAPGETVVARLNFKYTPAPRQERGQTVILELVGGQRLTVPAPPFRAPDKPITAIAYAADYSRVFVQYRSPQARPRRVWLNGQEITSFTVVNGSDQNKVSVLACAPPAPINTGQAVHVRIQFKDGREAHALVRALNSISLDAYLIPDKERAKLVAQLGLDMEVSLVEFGASSFFGDPACYDLQAGRPGAAAVGMIVERSALYRKQPGKLSFLHYCTGYYNALWNVNGSVADMAFSSYYGLSHWQDVSRWLDNEESFMDKAWRSAQPAPWGWVADVFRRKARFAEPEEIRTLAWVALAKGAKAIKYFAYHLDMADQAGFDQCPPLREAVAALNRDIAAKRTVLASLIPVAEWTIGDPQSGLKVYTAWAVDLGLLAVVRNLDYRTDDQANDNGAAQRFRVNVKTNVAVTLNAPAWLNWRDARDFLTDELLPTAGERVRPQVKLAKLEALKVLWLPQAPPAKPIADILSPTPAPAMPPPASKETFPGRLIIVVVIGMAVLAVGFALWRRR